MQELGSTSERGGGGRGHGYGDDGGELRSVVCARGEQRRGWGPGGEDEGEGEREGPGGCVAMPGESRAKRQVGGGRRWPCACWRAMGTRPPAHWQEVEDSRSEEEVGWA